ncbi:hypothetical protein [Methylogaea oryzae]|uniref:hypothetical protein n=1 Tax=Methylogaea oryzae TaxID=1295382 RepID=UPI0020D0E57C|nr:hypothetical protein [Methylogaea oryzae]
MSLTTPPPPPPKTLPGFEHIKRSWNAKYAAYAARILPGEFYVTRSQEGVYTTLARAFPPASAIPCWASAA